MSQKNNIEIGEINGSGNSIAARDVVNNKTTINQNFTGYSSADKVDDGVMNEIFSHIENLKLASSTNKDTSSNKENSNEIINLKEKIPLNFNEDCRNEFYEFMTNSAMWKIKQFVQDFVAIKLETKEDEILAIKDKIQGIYRNIKDSDSSETKIENIRVIDNMVQKLVPPSKNGASIYELYTKAVICYFFEFCDFGKKTKVEEKNRKTL